ncbi:MAG TPA: hypothetical protein VFA47_12455, partial [Candidatus Manganitrophaceae bacterium]|nr:hypothetical protein [Candidatus Manganitrophaceae bacterium]
MKGSNSKSVALFPVLEKEAGPYLESVFLSRFFAGREREEAIAWIGLHFPEWAEEARRQADRLLREGIRPEPPSGRQEWKRLLKERALSSFSTRPLSRNPDLLSESFDQRLLVIGKGYWYTGRSDYIGPILGHRGPSLFETRRWGKEPNGPVFPPWKGVWLLRFMVGIASHEETGKLWQLLIEQAARLSRGNGRESAEKGLFLLMMGVLFIELPEAPFWKSEGTNMLERELFRRVGRDGVCRSKNLSDQVALLYIYLQAILLARRANGFTERVERRVEKMLEFLAAHREHPLLTRIGSRPPFSLQRAEGDAVAKVLGIGAVVFERNDLKKSTVFSEEAFFLTGREGYLFHEEKRAADEGGSVIFDEAGYAVLKGASLGVRKLIFESEEPFSPSLEEGGGPLPFSIFAPGPLFPRSPELRLHSEALTPSSLSSRFLGGRRRNGEGRAPFDRFFLGDDFDYVEGGQPPAPEIDRSLRQKRSILFIKPSYWVVHDVFSGQGDFDAEVILPFAPEAKVEGNPAEGFHITLPSSRAWMVPLGTHLKGLELREPEGEKQLSIRNAGPLPVSLTTVLYPE